MASVQQVSNRAERHIKDREVLDRSFLVPEIRRYADSDKRAPFAEYFYPPELAILESNDFEEWKTVRERTDSFFNDEHDLKAFEENFSDPSSNNEDRPPASEEAFFESGEEDLFDDIAQTTGYIPPLTQLQRNLLRSIARYVFSAADNVATNAFKRDKRLEFVRGYCKDLKRKRFARAYRRYRKTRAKKLSLGAEALDLLEQEIIDKQLNRTYYYEASEPSEYTTLLLPARRNAVKTKFYQVLVDPNFRRGYRDRIYYNVNVGVPENDTYHMLGDSQLDFTGLNESGISSDLCTSSEDSCTQQEGPYRHGFQAEIVTKRPVMLVRNDLTRLPLRRRAVKNNKEPTSPPPSLPPLMVQSDLFSWAIQNVIGKVELTSRIELDATETGTQPKGSAGANNSTTADLMRTSTRDENNNVTSTEKKDSEEIQIVQVADIAELKKREEALIKQTQNVAEQENETLLEQETQLENKKSELDQTEQKS